MTFTATARIGSTIITSWRVVSGILEHLFVASGPVKAVVTRWKIGAIYHTGMKEAARHGKEARDDLYHPTITMLRHGTGALLIRTAVQCVWSTGL